MLSSSSSSSLALIIIERVGLSPNVDFGFFGEVEGVYLPVLFFLFFLSFLFFLFFLLLLF